MLAWPRPIQTGTRGLNLVGVLGKKMAPRLGEDCLDIRWHLAILKFDGVGSLAGQRGDHVIPGGFGKRGNMEFNQIWHDE